MYKVFCLVCVCMSVWLAGCSDKPLDQPPVSRELEGNISRLTISDSTIARMFQSVQKELPARLAETLGEVREHPGNIAARERLMVYLPAIFYLRPMADTVVSWLANVPEEALPELSDAYVTAAYYAYLQSGDKQILGDDRFPWAFLGKAMPVAYQDAGHKQGSDTTVLNALMKLKRQGELAYLAIESGKDSIARILVNALMDPSLIVNKAKSETEKVLSLGIAEIPLELSATMSRDVQASLLEQGLKPAGGALELIHLFTVLTQYEQGELVLRMLPELKTLFPGDSLTPQVAFIHWVMRDVVGFRPDLDVPGMRRLEVHPHLVDGLNVAEGQLKTTAGLVFSRWDRLRPLRVQFEIPGEATLVLPIKNPTKATIVMNSTRLWMGGQPQPMPEGVALAGVNQQGIYLRVVNDKYVFQLKD